MQADDQNTPTPKRRPKRALTLAERISVIELYQQVPNTRYLAKRFDCGRTQIQNILRHKEEYIQDWNNCADPSRIRRRASAGLTAVNVILHEWFQRYRHYPHDLPSDEMFREMSLEIAKTMQVAEFKATNRWLERFKRKYRIEMYFIAPYWEEQAELKSLDLNDIIADIRLEFGTDALFNTSTNSDTKNVTLCDMGALKRAELYRVRECRQEAQKSFGTLDSMDDRSVLDSIAGSSPSLVEIISDDEVGSGEETQQMNGEALTKNHNDTMVDDCDVGTEPVREIQSYREALNHLGPLEQFALLKENIRAIGLINQLENLFQEEMVKKEMKHLNAPSP